MYKILRAPLFIPLVFLLAGCKTSWFSFSKPSEKQVNEVSSSKNLPKDTVPIQKVHQLGKGSYRIEESESAVWEAMTDVLIKNYNINVLDRENKVITTEWDSFYMDGLVYRNKVTAKLNKYGWGTTDIMIVNNVEVLKDSFAQIKTVGPVWFPDEDKAGESERIISNVAVLLGQSRPVFQEAQAKDVSP